MKDRFDVIVIGAGHAGIEAVNAASKLGVKVLLITLSIDNIGKLSCNPAVGGIAKSHLVREVDALGGCIARLTDKSSLQYRVLNRSKGKAVWATRVQADRFKYQEQAKNYILSLPGLTVLEAEALDLVVKNKKIIGVETNIGLFASSKVIITAGTFLDSLIHIGFKHFSGGRLGEISCKSIFKSIKKQGIKTKHFKTGTCARLDKTSIDFSNMIEQKPDKDCTPFSFFTDFKPYNKHSCYITSTNKKTHRIINRNLKYSPLYQGIIKSTGVRYCPSLEDKVVRFKDKDRHQIFVEPEGKDSIEVYPNGISTSLPLEVQYKFIHSIEGLENARIIRPGYGIEHGVIDARELHQTLECKKIKGLYFAGQVNGTTGYEEAAAQGIVAGINAAKKTPFVLSRSESFIGMLIDELTTKGTNEPYRVFTSRSEYRLLLRENNALYRLYEYSYKLGLISKQDHQRIKEKQELIKSEQKRLKAVKIYLKKDKVVDALSFLKRPGVSYKGLAKKGVKLNLKNRDEIDEVEIETKYEGFIQRERKNAQNLKKLDKIKIPKNMNFKGIPGISGEIQEKLTKAHPKTLQQAQSISGITPAALIILMGYLKKRK